MRTAGELAPRTRSVLASRLVGRDEERASLAERTAAARDGRGGVVFLLGEAGIGKSRLTREAADLAAATGMRTLRGRAVESQTPVAYRPLSEAMCGAVRAFGLPEDPALGPFRPVLGRLVPEWRAPETDAGASMVTLSEGVLRFLHSLADGDGCLVVLEDLHWSDPETLQVLEYLADNVADSPVLCVATARLEDRAPVVDLARALHARRSADVIEPARLRAQEVAEMVAACLGSDAVADEILALARRSEGVPFLVEELLAVAVASGSLVDLGDRWSLSRTVEPVVPFTFADGVRRRLAMLGDGQRAVLDAAAVLGRRFDGALLPHITGLDEHEVLDGLHAAIDAQIVAVDAEDGSFRFRHALSRDAVLAELLPPERASLSARALAALEGRQLGSSAGDLELAAELAQQAGDRHRAADLLLEVARSEFRRGALATVEATLERARLLVPSDAPAMVDIERLSTEVLALAGKWEAARAAGAALLDRLGADPGAASARAEVHLQLARAAVAAGRFVDVLEHVERARADAGPAGDDTLLARADVLAAEAAMGLDRTEEAAALARHALEQATAVGLHDVTCEALEITGRCLRPRDLDGAEQAFARAHALAVEQSLVVWEIRALHELGTIVLLAGRGVGRLREARERAWSCGALATAAVLDVQIAAGLAVGGEPDEAVAAARRGAALGARHHLDETVAASYCFEALAHARSGDRAELDRCQQQATAATPGSRNVDMLCGLARAVLAFVEENRGEAASWLGAAAAIQAASVGDRASGPITGLWALLAAVEGDPLPAQQVAPDAEPVHYIGGASLRCARAVLSGRAGDVAGALELAREGDAMFGDATWFRHYARRLVAEAALADGWPFPTPWLLEALAYFDARGDERIASACRALLRRAGVPVPRRRGEAVAPELRAMGITGRELEVLRLLADGLSNQEIAARLYLSPRTVERHVANMSVKIGVERRAQLVAFAARAGVRLLGG